MTLLFCKKCFYCADNTIDQEMRRVASLIFPLAGVSGRGKPLFLSRFRLGQDARCAGKCEKRHWLLSTEHTFHSVEEISFVIHCQAETARNPTEVNRCSAAALSCCV